MKNISITTLLALLFTGPVFSANAWFDASINTMLVHDDGTIDHAGLVHVTMNTEMTWVPSCVVNDAYKKYFLIDLSRPASTAQYSLLLSAQIAGKSVTVQINDKCNGGMALIRNVNIAE